MQRIAPFRAGLIAVLLSPAIATGVALAGVVDTPLPTFTDGKPSLLLMVVPGVVKRDRMETVFLCSSFDALPVDIGVEIFDAAGVRLNDVGAGEGAILNVGNGQTVTIGTSGTAAFLESVAISLTALPQGSARIVATSDRVRCNVLITDDAVSPPVALATLGEGVRPTLGPVPPTIPFPQFSDGSMATHSALIPGVVKRARMETDFFCTSLSPTAVHVGIEILSSDGFVQNSVAMGNGAVLNLAPGTTATFGTSGTAAFLEDQIIVIPGVAQGAARIVSTSGDVACTAFALDAVVAPPVSISGLAQGAE